MYFASISRLTSTASKQILRQTLTKPLPKFVRLASTSNQQNDSNEKKKENFTNLIYIVGALTGAGAIYSIVNRLTMTKNRSQRFFPSFRSQIENVPKKNKKPSAITMRKTTKQTKR